MPSSDNQTAPAFQGFRSPNYTPVPDELFDELLVELSGAELKALLYIVRRTFGFKRDSDNISLSQMLNGITARDGRPLDRGVGLSKKTLLLALRTLEERGIIVTERRQSVEKGNEPTTYRLNVVDPGLGPNGDPGDDPDSGRGPGDGHGEGPDRAPPPPGEESTPPLGEKLHQGGPGGETTPPLGEKLHQGLGVKSTPSPWCKNYTTQETVEQETGIQETDRSISFDLTPAHINTGSDAFAENSAGSVYVQPGFDGVAGPAARGAEAGGGPAGTGSIGADSAPTHPLAAPGAGPKRRQRNRRRPPAHADAPERSTAAFSASLGARVEPRTILPDSGALRPAQRRADRPPTPPADAPGWVDALIRDFSAELHDEEHASANVSRTARLRAGSGLSDDEFRALLYEARRVTKSRGNIEKRAGGELGQYGARNRMPYFFSVLRNLLAASPPPGGPGRP